MIVEELTHVERVLKDMLSSNMKDYDKIWHKNLRIAIGYVQSTRTAYENMEKGK